MIFISPLGFWLSKKYVLGGYQICVAMIYSREPLDGSSESRFSVSLFPSRGVPKICNPSVVAWVYNESTIFFLLFGLMFSLHPISIYILQDIFCSELWNLHFINENLKKLINVSGERLKKLIKKIYNHTKVVELCNIEVVSWRTLFRVLQNTTQVIPILFTV